MGDDGAWWVEGGVTLQFGGWVDGMAVVCGGEDSQGALYDDCWSYNPDGPTDDSWTWLLEMQVACSDPVSASSSRMRLLCRRSARSPRRRW